ncbi:YhcN/YlaJ family sporulation lipoprotein [Paenibacillus aceti]|uniref:Sporulation protein n=1 Tax=Paenibacillus aceti TaxID=1820010 RepID=A0ABQ1VQC9_9BACL|nr:YhcN/YlaJ family sporulation lipoprotein [Paenibacillus aceti]GGF89691.1 hypothetical protein GCM10010913_08860 [Paenibacillus aceti]
MRGHKIISLSLSAALIAGMVSITGCGTTTKNNNVRTQSLRQTEHRYDVNSVKPGNRMFTRSAGHGTTQRIHSLKSSPILSNKISGLADVRTAHVLVSDRDAYVALTLHDNNGVNRSSGISAKGLGNPLNSTGISRTRGTGMNGITNGTRGGTGAYGMNGTYGTNGLHGVNTNGLNGTYGTYNTNMGGTRGGTMNRSMSPFSTNTNNNTGTVRDHVPQHVKDEITQKIKKTAPHIQNVYISSDPDFVTEAGGYTTQSRDGASLNGSISNFERIVERIFPGRTGTMTGPSGYTPSGVNNTTTDGYRTNMHR